MRLSGSGEGLEETPDGKRRLAPPRREHVVEAAAATTLAQRREHRSKLLQLALHQLLAGPARPIEQSELHEELTADISHVADGGLEPAPERGASARRDTNDRALRAPGTGCLATVLDQSLARERRK